MLGRWSEVSSIYGLWRRCHRQCAVLQVRLPLSSVCVAHRFVVLRTTILVTEKEAEKMTDMLYTILTHRIVTMVLKQQLVTLTCPVQASETKTKKRRRTKIGVNVSQGQELELLRWNIIKFYLANIAPIASFLHAFSFNFLLAAISAIISAAYTGNTYVWVAYCHACFQRRFFIPDASGTNNQRQKSAPVSGLYIMGTTFYCS